MSRDELISRLFSLRDVQEAVALTLCATNLSTFGDVVPQEVWDSLHGRGLVRTSNDDLAMTFTRPAGEAYFQEKFGG